MTDGINRPSQRLKRKMIVTSLLSSQTYSRSMKLPVRRLSMAVSIDYTCVVLPTLTGTEPWCYEICQVELSFGYQMTVCNAKNSCPRTSCLPDLVSYRLAIIYTRSDYRSLQRRLCYLLTATSSVAIINILPNPNSPCSNFDHPSSMIRHSIRIEIGHTFIRASHQNLRTLVQRVDVDPDQSDGKRPTTSRVDVDRETLAGIRIEASSTGMSSCQTTKHNRPPAVEAGLVEGVSERLGGRHLGILRAGLSRRIQSQVIRTRGPEQS